MNLGRLLALSIDVTVRGFGPRILTRVTREFLFGDYPLDVDGDGVVDTTMQMDENNDGIPDVDMQSAGHARLRVGDDALVAASGQRIELGVYSGAGRRAANLDAGRAGARIDGDRTIPDSLRNGLLGYDGIYDFIVHLPLGTRSARVVVPLQSPIPSGARYWKYRRFGVPGSDDDRGFWSPFVISGDGDAVFSAPRPCPAPHGNGWTTPAPGGFLREGHECILLVIRDGGENDDDERRNYAVTDPGAVGTGLPNVVRPQRPEPPRPTPTAGTSSGGSSAMDLLLIFTLFLMVLAGIFAPRVNAFNSPFKSR